jgi:hypothetical protein
MKPSDIARARNALKTERQRLTEDRAALDRRERDIARRELDDARKIRAYEQERADAVDALVAACTRFGDLDWDASTPLAEIIADHLAEPLEHMVARTVRRVRRLEAEMSAPVDPPARAEPLSVVENGPVRHATMAVRSGDRVGRTGFIAVCTCGWRSPLSPYESAAADNGRAHESARFDRRA